MDGGATILVIEDDPGIRKFLRVSLTSHGYVLVESATGRDGLAQASGRNPDVIILDLGLPDMDGVEITRQVRGWSSAVPIIVVSARGREQDKVAALDSGADDYLTKPFSIGELLARVRAALRRREREAGPAPALYAIGELKIDTDRRRITVADREVHLTPNEYRLLVTLAKNAGRVVTHQDLLRAVLGPNPLQETHYLRVYVNQLRQKIEQFPSQPRYVLTEPGVGYRMPDQG